MTRSRIYGEDSPFGSWLRGNKELPSTQVVASDVDWVIHNYKQVVDKIGTRDIQSLMIVEAKQYNGKPSESQRDTLFKLHQTSKSIKEVNGQYVRHWGVSILVFEKTTPADSKWIAWGRFRKNGEIDWGDERPGARDRFIDETTLEKLLRFDLHPDSLLPEPFRRHKPSNALEELVTQPLGFSIYEKLAYPL